jgi:hypothetical protein
VPGHEPIFPHRSRFKDTIDFKFGDKVENVHEGTQLDTEHVRGARRRFLIVRNPALRKLCAQKSDHVCDALRLSLRQYRVITHSVRRARLLLLQF